jgi:hypothetical protein
VVLARTLAAALTASLGLMPVASRAAAPMSFAVTELGDVSGGCDRNCVEVISAQGEINNDTADAFVSFLSSQMQDRNIRPVILLESPGGTVVGAMQLGMVFRKIGAEVVVGSAVQVPGTAKIGLAPGLCMSACVYAFFGGKKRVVPTVSRLGIHRMVINEFSHELLGGTSRQQIFGNEEIVSALAGYTKMMGIDPQVIYYAERVAPEEIHILTPKEIARWRLGTPKL